MALARRRAEAAEDSEQRFAGDGCGIPGVLREWSTADNSLHGEGHSRPLVGDLPMLLNEPADVFFSPDWNPQDRDLVVEAPERTQSSQTGPGRSPHVRSDPATPPRSPPVAPMGPEHREAGGLASSRT